MSRSHFALAIALVVIAATLVFVKTFPEDPAQPDTPRSERATPVAGQHGSPSRNGFRSSKPLTPRAAAGSHFEIGFDQQTLASLTDEQRRQALGYATRAEADARSTLAELAAKYDLTRQQQRDIFPIVAAHTGSYHPSMTVNGVPVIPAPADSSLEESIHGSLDPEQQAALEDAMLDDIKWWQEIANQLENDLDTAIGTGDVTIGGPAISVDTTPAEGDGEAASHSGGNIFDLLNQGN
jgi:hypothetical protein